MKRQNVLLMLFLAVLLVAGTAESAGLGNARQTVVLECGVVTPEPENGSEPEPGPMPANTTESPSPSLEVIAVSGTPEAPAISIGDPCGTAIGELMNNRFRLLSATPTSPALSPGSALPLTPVSSVQYLFVSWPGFAGR